MHQHQGFRAFFRESSASETLKSAIAAHTILEETVQKIRLLRLLIQLGSLFINHHRVDKAPVSLQSFEESS